MAISTPQTRYESKYIRRIQLKLNTRTDADLLAHLEAQPNMQGYIKSLIRADLEKEEAR